MSRKVFKLAYGQFKSAKIKTQNAKLLNPPAADTILDWIAALVGMPSYI